VNGKALYKSIVNQQTELNGIILNKMTHIQTIPNQLQKIGARVLYEEKTWTIKTNHWSPILFNYYSIRFSFPKKSDM